MSVEFVTSPVWGIFEPEQVDLSTVEKEWVEYRELNVVSPAGLTKLEIETRDKDSFILPHEGYLDVKFKIMQADGTKIPPTDCIALQNNVLTLFKDAEYMIEDQRIEFIDNPGMTYTIKNIADYSKQYGESIASNQHFYLDNSDVPTGRPNYNNNVRFYNNTAPRVGVELFFTVNAGGNAVPTVAAAIGTWQNGDAIIASYNGLPIVFRTGQLIEEAGVVRNLVMSGGLLSLAAGGADDDYVTAFVGGVGGLSGSSVTFYANNVKRYPQQDGLAGGGTPDPIDNLGANGDILTLGVAVDMTYSPDKNGFHKRQAQAALSEEVCAWVPFKDIFMFCRAYDKISRGLRHRLVFNKNSDNNMLLRSGGADRNVQITHISAWIPRLKPSIETLKMVESKLISNGEYSVHFTDLTYWSTPNHLEPNANNSAIQLATTTKKPIRVWVAFQTKTRVEGGQTTNKRVFDHINTSAIQVRLNGKIFPLYEYKFGDNFTKYNRAYMALLNSAYKMADHDTSSMITYEMFKSLYPIFYFDLTHQEEDLYKANKYAELEVRWSNLSGVQYYMHVVYESERLIKFKGVGGSLALAL